MRPTKFAPVALLAPAVVLGLAASGTSSAAVAPRGAGHAARTTSSVSTAPYPSLASCRSRVTGETRTKGVLTVATDNPVYTPWFVDNTPTNGKGYESAVAYDVASLLGFPRSKVRWVTESFDASYAPGPKAFDFDINEVSVTPERAKAVTFSISYYDTTQSIVSLRSDAIVHKHTPAELRSYLYGDQIGTTGLAYINDHIHPTRAARVYNTLPEAVQALQTHQVDAVVVDTPDGQYMASSEVKGGVQVGQFPSTGEHYGLLFAKGDPLVSCVDSALEAMTRGGTLASLSKRYLGTYNSTPMLKP